MQTSADLQVSISSFPSSALSCTSFASSLAPAPGPLAPSVFRRMTPLLLSLLILPLNICLLISIPLIPSPLLPAATFNNAYFVAAAAAAYDPFHLEKPRRSAEDDVDTHPIAGEEIRVSEGERTLPGGIKTEEGSAGQDDVDNETAADVAGDNRKPEDPTHHSSPPEVTAVNTEEAGTSGDKTSTSDSHNETATPTNIAEAKNKARAAGQTSEDEAESVSTPSSVSAAALNTGDVEDVEEKAMLGQDKRQKVSGTSQRETGEEHEGLGKDSKGKREELQNNTEEEDKKSQSTWIWDVITKPFQKEEKESETDQAKHTQASEKPELATSKEKEREDSSLFPEETGQAHGPSRNEEGQPSEEKEDRMTSEASSTNIEKVEKDAEEKKRESAERKAEELPDEESQNAERKAEGLSEKVTEEEEEKGHTRKTSAKRGGVEEDKGNGGSEQAKEKEGRDEEGKTEGGDSGTTLFERVYEKGGDRGVQEAAEQIEKQSTSNDGKNEEAESGKREPQDVDASAKEARGQEPNFQRPETQEEQHAGAGGTPSTMRKRGMELQLGGDEELHETEQEEKHAAEEVMDTNESEREGRTQVALQEEQPATAPQETLEETTPQDTWAKRALQEIPTQTAAQRVLGKTGKPQEMQKGEERQGTESMRIQPQRPEWQSVTPEEMMGIIKLLIEEDIEAKEELVEEDAEALDAEDKKTSTESSVSDAEEQVAKDDKAKMSLRQEEGKDQEKADDAGLARETPTEDKAPPLQERQQEKVENETADTSRGEDGRFEQREENKAEKQEEVQPTTKEEDIAVNAREKGETADRALIQEMKMTDGEESDELLKQQEEETRKLRVQQRSYALEELNNLITSLASLAERFEVRQAQWEKEHEVSEQHPYLVKGEAQMQGQLLKENEDTLLELLKKQERLLQWMGQESHKYPENRESDIVVSNLRRVGDSSMSREEMLHCSQETQKLIHALAGAVERFHATLTRMNECRRAFSGDHANALQVIYEYGRAVDLLNISVGKKRLPKQDIEERLQACNEAVDVLYSLLATCDERVASIVELTGALEVMQNLSLAYLRQVIEIQEKKETPGAATVHSTATAVGPTEELDEVNMNKPVDEKKNNTDVKLTETHNNTPKVTWKPGHHNTSSHVAALQNERKQLLEAAKQVVDILARLGRSFTQATRSVVKARVDWLEVLSTQLIEHFNSIIKAGEVQRAKIEVREEQIREYEEEEEDKMRTTLKELEQYAAEHRLRYLVKRGKDDKELARRIGKRVDVYRHPGTREMRTAGRLWLPVQRGWELGLEDEEFGDLADGEHERSILTHMLLSGEGGGPQGHSRRILPLDYLQTGFRGYADDAAAQCAGRAETHLLLDVNSEGWKMIQRMAEKTQFDSKLALEVREAIKKEVRNDSITILLGSLLGVSFLLLCLWVLYGYYMIFSYQKRINAYKLRNKAGETVDVMDEGEAVTTVIGSHSRDASTRG